MSGAIRVRVEFNGGVVQWRGGKRHGLAVFADGAIWQYRDDKAHGLGIDHGTIQRFCDDKWHGLWVFASGGGMFQFCEGRRVRI